MEFFTNFVLNRLQLSINNVDVCFKVSNLRTTCPETAQTHALDKRHNCGCVLLLHARPHGPCPCSTLTVNALVLSQDAA